MIRLEQLDHIAIRVSDMARSVRWYRDVLGLDPRGDVDGSEEEPIFLYSADTALALFRATQPAHRIQPTEDVAMMHFAFRTDRPGFDAAREQLKKEGIEGRFADHGNAHSVYIKDPDGYTVEITTYEI